MFEMANLHEDGLREYDELELCYSETGLLISCTFFPLLSLVQVYHAAIMKFWITRNM